MICSHVKTVINGNKTKTSASCLFKSLIAISNYKKSMIKTIAQPPRQLYTFTTTSMNVNTTVQCNLQVALAHKA